MSARLSSSRPVGVIAKAAMPPIGLDLLPLGSKSSAQKIGFFEPYDLDLLSTPYFNLTMDGPGTPRSVKINL